MHARANALRVEFRFELRAQLLDVGLALYASLIEQARDLLVGIGLQEAECEIFHLPLHLPHAQAIGQRREHVQRFARDAFGCDRLVRRVPAQRLQARSQAQHDHAQIARKGQQHLAYGLGLRLRIVELPGCARLLLDLHELGGLRRQRRVALAEGLGNHFLRLIQVHAGIDQVARRLHGLGATHGLQDRGHRVGMRERVLAGVQRLARNQRFGEGPRAHQRMRLVRHRLLGRCDQLGDGRGVSLLRTQAFHERNPTGTRQRPRPGYLRRTWARGPRREIR